MRKLRAIGTAGGASLVAMALLLAPAVAASSTQRNKAARPAAALARRGTTLSSDFRFTPASALSERSRAVRVAIRARAETPAQAARNANSGTLSAITPVSYNLGVSVGWRRFAVSGDVAQADGGLIGGVRESAQVGMSYRATRRLTGRVAVAAERADGGQRIITDDQAYSLDVGGAFSIARNLDVTAGARYRIARDRLEPLARDERRDSQAVYVGTAFRF